MSAFDQGQEGSGAAPGSQSARTTLTFEAAPTANSSTTASSSSGSSKASSSNTGEKTIIIGVAIGGLGALLLLSLLVKFCVQRRKKQELLKKQKGAEPDTYTGLNSTFSGVPFRGSRHGSLSPRPLLLSNSNTTFPGAPSPGGRASMMEGFRPNCNPDFDFPQYSPQHSPQCSLHDSQFHAYPSSHTRSHSLTRSRTHSRPLSRAESHSSRLTLNDPSEEHVLSSHGAFGAGESEPSRLQAQQARDTMGFPVEQAVALDEIRLQNMTPATAALEDIKLQPMTPVLLSKSRHLLAHQESLERLVRRSVSASSPAPSDSPPGRLRDISQDHPRLPGESPVLGYEHPFFIQNPPITAIFGVGPRRNESQRTVSSISTIGPGIGDKELEHMGIGAMPQPLRLRKP